MQPVAATGDVASNIRHVTDIVGNIANAGNEQRVGLVPINQAIARMDPMKQRAAALVERMTQQLQREVDSFDQAVRRSRMTVGQAVA